MFHGPGGWGDNFDESTSIHAASGAKLYDALPRFCGARHVKFFFLLLRAILIHAATWHNGIRREPFLHYSNCTLQLLHSALESARS